MVILLMHSYMDVSENSGTPQIIHFNRVFHYKPSILGYPYFWKHLERVLVYILRVFPNTFQTILPEESCEGAPENLKTLATLGR